MIALGIFCYMFCAMLVFLTALEIHPRWFFYRWASPERWEPLNDALFRAFFVWFGWPVSWVFLAMQSWLNHRERILNGSPE